MVKAHPQDIKVTRTQNWGPFFLSDEFVEEEDRNYTLRIDRREQFETAVHCLNHSCSFRVIPKLFAVLGEVLGNMKLQKPNERQIGQYIRFLVSTNLAAMQKNLSSAWGFLIMVDGATHTSQGYLDVRVAFAVQECQRRDYFAFVAGIASVSPGTHTVESDFSHLMHVTDVHRRSLTNFALEGQLQAKQYFEMIKLANDT